MRLAAARPAKISSLALFAHALAALSTVAGAVEPGLWPWAAQNPEKPPAVKPYEIPTFEGAARDFRAAPTGWVKAPRVDGDAVYAMILNCYPAKSRWRLNVGLQAALKTAEALDVTGTTIGRSYVGVVARMPLYSSDDQDREREREYRRRVDTAGLVADYVGAIASRNHAVRNVALAGSLEQRARVRVAEGIADAEEQVKYLDKVAASENALVTAEAKIMQARLALVSMCRDDEADRVNAYLSGQARLPAQARP